MFPFRDSDTDIIAVAACDALQHRDGKKHIVIVGCLPVTLVHPQVLKTLGKVVLAFFNHFAQPSDGNLIIMFKIIATFHITDMSHVLFVGTKRPTATVEGELPDKRLAIFTGSTLHAVIQICGIFHHRFRGYQVIYQIFQNNITVGSAQAEEVIRRFGRFGDKHNISPCANQVQIEHGTKRFHFSIHLLCLGRNVTGDFGGKKR